jgi:cystathionine gamma-synthase
MMSLEGAQDAVACSSGMAAITITLMALLQSGDRIVSVKDLYGGTYVLLTKLFPKFGINATVCETTDFARIEKEMAKGCRIIYLESPTNPTLKVVDLPRLIKFAHKNSILAIVDNTFATPINQSPLELGAHLVIHSATKYLGGHGDVLAGIVCGRKSLIAEIYHFREITGTCLDPHAAFLLSRGLKTLELRIQKQNESALVISEYLEKHPRVKQVFYPGLKSHPGHAIAEQQMRGYGGVLSFEIAGGLEAAIKFIEHLKLASRAANLGAVETLAGIPATTSHVECTPKERRAAGIPEGLVRYSVGIENTEDLITDISQALAEI